MYRYVNNVIWTKIFGIFRSSIALIKSVNMVVDVRSVMVITATVALNMTSAARCSPSRVAVSVVITRSNDMMGIPSGLENERKMPKKPPNGIIHLILSAINPKGTFETRMSRNTKIIEVTNSMMLSRSTTKIMNVMHARNFALGSRLCIGDTRVAYLSMCGCSMGITILEPFQAHIQPPTPHLFPPAPLKEQVYTPRQNR